MQKTCKWDSTHDCETLHMELKIALPYPYTLINNSETNHASGHATARSSIDATEKFIQKVWETTGAKERMCERMMRDTANSLDQICQMIQTEYPSKNSTRDELRKCAAHLKRIADKLSNTALRKESRSFTAKDCTSKESRLFTTGDTMLKETRKANEDFGSSAHSKEEIQENLLCVEYPWDVLFTQHGQGLKPFRTTLTTETVHNVEEFASWVNVDGNSVLLSNPNTKKKDENNVLFDDVD